MKMRLNTLQKLLIAICSTFLIFGFILISPEKRSLEGELGELSIDWSQEQFATSKSREIVGDLSKIAIILVVTKETNPNDYVIAIETTKCYAQVQGYDFVLTDDTEYDCDMHRDKFFRRHCVITKFLPHYKAVLFLDADIGVVNPKKRIEEFLSDDVDVYFYNRFYNWEVATGAYILKNTQFAMKFIQGFANYEFKLPDSFHGSDNGAFHLYLAEHFFPDRKIELDLCRSGYRKSKDYNDLFAFEACIRSLYGARTDFGKIRIMKKGDGFIRDDWLTSGIWNPQRDFMLHGWKMKFLKSPPKDLKIGTMDQEWWYNPLGGRIDLERCIPGNTTWTFNRQLIRDAEEVNEGLRKVEAKVALDNIKDMSRLLELITRKSTSFF